MRALLVLLVAAWATTVHYASCVTAFVPPSSKSPSFAAGGGGGGTPDATAAPSSFPGASTASAAPLTRMAAAKKKGGGSSKKKGGGGNVKSEVRALCVGWVLGWSLATFHLTNLLFRLPLPHPKAPLADAHARAAKHMKVPSPDATRAEFGAAPGFELELLPPADRDSPPVTATGSSTGMAAEDEHTTDSYLRLLRQTGKFPVLVLNTDAQPLSYLPLSIIRWQEAIKGIFLDRLTVLDYYDSYIQSTAGPWYVCVWGLCGCVSAVSCVCLPMHFHSAFIHPFPHKRPTPWHRQLPSVVCLKTYQKGCRERPPPLNRRNIYIRDSFCCAYCSTRLKAIDLTLDHVLPRSKGGKGSWDNLVTCCK